MSYSDAMPKILIVIIIIIIMTTYLVIELSAVAVAFTSYRISLNLNDANTYAHESPTSGDTISDIISRIHHCFSLGNIEERPYEKYT